jgi:serine/threonine protein kinase
MRTEKIGAQDISFTAVADMYLDELRKGTPLSIEVLAKTFPHIANELREQLPALALLEKTIGQSAAPPIPAPPDDLGGCKIMRELGRGAVGVVYEALQKDLGRKVAVKVIPVQSQGPSVSVERFELERLAMGRLEHPNIVPVYSCGFDGEHAYLIMKLIDGHSLYDLQQGLGNFRIQFHYSELKSNWDQLAQFGATIASGLQHAHDQGLVHRDVKPGNLLLDEEGKVWISDFGLAKLFDYSRSLSGTGDAIGTPRYMAPEQLRGVCDCRSDVYSLGITLYELASGVRAWGDATNLSLMTNRSSLTLGDLRGVRAEVPADLAAIIMKACALAPDERYQSAQELEYVLKRFLNKHYPGDRRRKLREPDEVFRKKSKHRMAMGAAGIAAASLLVGVASVWLGRGTDASQPAPEMARSTEPRFVRSNDNTIALIDRLADQDQDDMVAIVSDFVSEELDKTSTELNFSETTRRQLRSQVDTITDQIKTTGLTEESLDKFLDSYRQSLLPVATRVMRLSLIVEKSGLVPHERNAAISMLRGLSAAALNGYATEQQVNAYVNELVGPHVKTTAEIATFFIQDQQLRLWLGRLQQRLSALPPEAFEVQGVIERELQKVNNHAFGTIQPGKPVGSQNNSVRGR